MKHILPKKAFESDLLDVLRGIGAGDFIWNVNLHLGRKPSEKSEMDDIGNWKGPSGERVQEANGSIGTSGDSETYSIDFKLSNGNYIEVDGSLQRDTANSLSSFMDMVVNYRDGGSDEFDIMDYMEGQPKTDLPIMSPILNAYSDCIS